MSLKLQCSSIVIVILFADNLALESPSGEGYSTISDGKELSDHPEKLDMKNPYDNNREHIEGYIYAANVPRLSPDSGYDSARLSHIDDKEMKVASDIHTDTNSSIKDSKRQVCVTWF